MSIKTILVEDEELARDIVKSYLKQFSEIEILTECADGFSAVKAINELKPDLIFLDVQMPKLTGFEVLELIEHKPVIIFTTAYDQFALKAFEMNATDYLLKPFSTDRFKIAVDKAIEKCRNNQADSQKINKLLDTVAQNPELLSRVVVKTGNKIKVVPTDKIVYIESQDDYVMIYTDESKHLKEKTMKYFETHLDGERFVRIHRSYIVNVEHIVQLEHFAKDSYVVVLRNGLKLKVSDSGYKNLKQRLNF